jgi:hypothetical protein
MRPLREEQPTNTMGLDGYRQYPILYSAVQPLQTLTPFEPGLKTPAGSL